MKKIVLLLTLLIGANLFSQDWEEILKGNDNKYYYKPNTDTTAWIKETSDKMAYYPTNSKNKKIIDGYKIVLYKFDCSEKQIGILQMTVYSKSGKVVSSAKISELFVEMNYVIPDSIGEGMLNLFCEK